jgi:prevent-host-death family protein
MTKRKTIAETRDNLARLIHEVEEGEPVEITRRGRPVAVLLSIATVERLRSGKGGFWDAVERFRDENDLEELDLAEALEDLREPSPGRAIEM